MTIHQPFRPARRPAVVVAVAVMALLLVACGDDDASEATTTKPPAPEIELTDAWARTSPAVASAGAVYMTIMNTGELGDSLRQASVDASVAATVELHETVEAEGEGAMTTEMGSETTEMGSGTTQGGGGMMSMQPVDEIPVPAGAGATLEPGGYHVMLLELAEPLEVGTTITVTLTFEQFGSVEVVAEVRDTAP